MKRILFLLFILPFFAYSQTGQTVNYRKVSGADSSVFATRHRVDSLVLLKQNISDTLIWDASRHYVDSSISLIPPPDSNWTSIGVDTIFSNSASDSASIIINSVGITLPNIKTVLTTPSVLTANASNVVGKATATQSEQLTWAQVADSLYSTPPLLIADEKIMTDNANDTLFSVVLGADSIFATNINYTLVVIDNDSTQFDNGIIHVQYFTAGTYKTDSITSPVSTFTGLGTLTPTFTLAKATTTLYVIAKWDSSVSPVAAGEMKLKYTATPFIGNFGTITLF